VDRDRIIQAVSNLLDNAVRLTPEGGQVVASAGITGPWVRISVRDTGPGVQPEIAERIFDRFSQGEERDGGSAGLGLAIVKGVAAAHDGTAEVESAPGDGSTFTLRLPVAGPAAGEERASEVLA
jgi:signal transduction histidine kinase